MATCFVNNHLITCDEIQLSPAVNDRGIYFELIELINPTHLANLEKEKAYLVQVCGLNEDSMNLEVIRSKDTPKHYYTATKISKSKIEFTVKD